MGGEPEDHKSKMEVRRLQTTKFIKENVIAGDERDGKVWELITDVPKVKAPLCYVLFVLNIIIPGNFIRTLTL